MESFDTQVVGYLFPFIVVLSRKFILFLAQYLQYPLAADAAYQQQQAQAQQALDPAILGAYQLSSPPPPPPIVAPEANVNMIPQLFSNAANTPATTSSRSTPAGIAVSSPASNYVQKRRLSSPLVPQQQQQVQQIQQQQQSGMEVAPTAVSSCLTHCLCLSNFHSQ